MNGSVIDWLLDCDLSIRWQVMCDLTHSPANEVAILDIIYMILT
jgi:hypothetical protein